MNGHKLYHRIMAMVLSFAMVWGLLPVSVAAENYLEKMGGEIVAFEQLPEETVNQSVALGTALEDLDLPASLTATVRLTAAEAQDSGVQDSGVLDSGEVPEESSKLTIPVPVSWNPAPDYDGNTAGTYVFTADTGELWADAELPEITVTVQAQTGGEITAFDALGDEVAAQMVVLGTAISDLNLPAQLAATVDGAQTQVSVTWASAPEYDVETAGSYVFSPSLPKGYALAEGVSLPTVTVITAANILPMLTGSRSTIWDGTTKDTRWYTGHESEDNYTITTEEELAGLAELVNNDGNTFSGKTVTLGADIVLNDVSDVDNWATTAPSNTWTPIGTDSNAFAGAFDGDDHTVSGIYINTTSNYQGLFGYIKDATVKNVGVTDSYINGSNYVGGVAGYNRDTVRNCYNTGSVTSSTTGSNVGGVIGFDDDGTVTSCYYDKETSAVTGGIGGSDVAGKAVGKSTAWMINATSTAGIDGDTAAFTNWDGENVWIFEADKYPQLRNMQEESSGKTFTAEVSPTSKIFDEAATGYSAQTAQEFTIKNTGTGTITGLAVALSAESNFGISKPLSPASVAPRGYATVSVRPKTGLAANTYTDN